MTRGHHTTREDWLQTAITTFRGWFDELGIDLPPVLISAGYGHTGQRDGVRGMCYMSAVSGGINSIFVTPAQGDDLVQLLKTVLHECAHATDDCASGHRGHFATTVKELGYIRPFTDSANVTPELQATLERMAADLGPYGGHRVFSLESGLTLPVGGAVSVLVGSHGARISSAGKPQTNRWAKFTCAQGSGYAVRATRGTVAEFGAPLCPCHKEDMEAA